MRKLRLYLETSAISNYFDKRDPYIYEETRKFWKKLKDFEVFVSPMVIQEIRKTPDSALRRRLEKLAEEFTLLEVDDEQVAKLAEGYIKAGIIPEKYRTDAIHLAIATVGEVDILVSWNFNHLVKRKTRIEANYINERLGYKTIEMLAPVEL